MTISRVKFQVSSAAKRPASAQGRAAHHLVPMVVRGGEEGGEMQRGQEHVRRQAQGPGQGAAIKLDFEGAQSSQAQQQLLKVVGIQLDPQRVEGYYNLGLVYRRKGQFDLSLQAYREAIRLNPRMADAYLNLANLYVEKQQYRLAVQNYDEALKLRPDWDKALEGRDHAREMLSSGAIPSVPMPAGPQPRGARPAAEMEKVVDPNTHGGLLNALHEHTSEAEALGLRFQQMLASELEGALKELSSVLLYSKGPLSELNDCLERFEHALDHLQTARQDLEQGITRLQQVDTQFPAVDH